MFKFAVAVAWWNTNQRDEFLKAWNIVREPKWLFLQQDVKREGGAKTKNKAIRRAIAAKAEMIVCLDDDCFPHEEGQTLEEFSQLHLEALRPQSVRMFEAITDPPSRGTPYSSFDLTMPVAASMGFWTGIGDYCAPRQLTFGATHPMSFQREILFGKYFPLCAMNYAFKPAAWDPWFYLIEDVGRFDDIWMGWLWQRKAYKQGYCFNLGGPLVRHSRQSNVWKNLQDEATYLEKNETLWIDIATNEDDSYFGLRSLLPNPMNET